MTRPRDPNRLSALVQAASAVFLEKGYRQTQMSAVASAMGVAPGTLYLYVEGKEALFELVLRCAMNPDHPTQSLSLPLRCSGESSLLAFIQKSLRARLRLPALSAAARAGSSSDPRAELESVVRELFRETSRNWLALKLLERSAADWPSLAGLWFGRHRPRVFALLAGYLHRRMASGALRSAPDPQLAARLIIEMVAAFAMHCRSEHDGPPLDQPAAEEVLLDAVLHAYAAALTSTTQKRTCAQ